MGGAESHSTHCSDGDPGTTGTHWRGHTQNCPKVVQKIGSKIIHKKEKCKKAKWLSEEALQLAVKKKERDVKSKGERGLSPKEFKSLAQNQIAKEAADCSVDADLFDHKNSGSWSL